MWKFFIFTVLNPIKITTFCTWLVYNTQNCKEYLCINFVKEGFYMGHLYNTGGSEVSIIKVFVKGRTRNLEDDKYGYSINIECYDVFSTEFIKQEVEKLSALVLNRAPEFLIYRQIKDKAPIMEFTASQFMSGCYKVNVINPLQEYIGHLKEYNNSVDIISKSMIERIVHLFSAFSVDSY